MKTILLFLLMFFSVSAEAGFEYGGSCYQDSASALEAYRDHFPFCCSGSPAMITAENIPSTIDAAGNVTTQLKSKAINAVNWTVGVSTVLPLAACDVTIIDSGHIPHVLAILATVFLFVFGLRMGANMSNKSGVI